MRTFQCFLFVLKRSYICYYITCMTVPLKSQIFLKLDSQLCGSNYTIPSQNFRFFGLVVSQKDFLVKKIPSQSKNPLRSYTLTVAFNVPSRESFISLWLLIKYDNISNRHCIHKKTLMVGICRSYARSGLRYVYLPAYFTNFFISSIFFRGLLGTGSECYFFFKPRGIFRINQTSKMELFVKIVNSYKSLLIFIKSSVLFIWLGSECNAEDMKGYCRSIDWFQPG